jgi:ribonuclease R
MMSEDRILALMRGKVTHPATASELMRLLRVPRDQRQALRRTLRGLVARGALVETRGRHYGLPDRMDLVPGRLSAHPDGYGFVQPDQPIDGVDGDVYVSRVHLADAMHGDRVLVRVEHRHDGGRAEGRVVRVLERASTRVVGRYEEDRGGVCFVAPFDRRLAMALHVPRGEEGGARPGDMVTVEITRWPTTTRPPLGRVVEVLGPIDAPGVDTTIIIRKHGIPDAHPAEVETEARRLGTEVRPKDAAGRTDFRGRVVVTIDGEHARDFDDAVSIERLANGHYWLGVHIADVAHYVRPGSALDEDARARGTSVYFPERAVHMFPASLATGLCSLRPHVDRLVQSCLMEVDAEGTVVRAEFHDGVIHSTARLTYTEVNAILTDGDPSVTERFEGLVPTLRSMKELFDVLHARRRRRGAIDFDLPEPEVLLDAEGCIEDIVASERNVAHKLIEEFMLLANETVASHLDRHQAPALYRIHERPDVLKVTVFEDFLSTLGYTLSCPPDAVRPAHFQRVIDRMRGRPEERPIALLMLRTMQKARYDAGCLGHFGLATETYTHFTSPIRRYPDLVVHRALRALRHGGPEGEGFEECADELPEIARHASEMERRADEAERELVQWKKVRFMADKVGEHFDGFVTGVAAFGLFVELVEHFVEGLVHVSSMADDYYRFLERAHALKGESTSRTYRLGDRVTVQVLRVDQERRQVDLGLVEILRAMRASAPARGARRSRAPGGAVARPPQGDKPGSSRTRARAQRPGRRERAARKGAKRR